jgi:hypothetical protein
MTHRAHVAAVDLGASSSRVMLGRVGHGTLDVTILANTTALVYVPGTDPAKVGESGDGGKTLRAENARCVSLVGVQGDAVVYRVGSGSYQFSVGSANLPAGTPKGCYA